MNTYYYSDGSDEIQAILRNGFVDNMKERDTGRLGVYVADAPGEPDPDFPDDELLEITLPAQIDTSDWRLVVPEKPCRWQEWLIPARIVNKQAKVRQLTKEQWEQAWAKYKDAQKLKAIESRGKKLSRANRNTEPDPEIIRQNAAAFEQLALKWRDSLTGEIAETELGIAVIYMILDYFDCDNSSDLYFCDLLAAVEEKLRLTDIKFHGLAGLPKKRDLSRN